MNALIWIGAGALALYLLDKGNTINSLRFLVSDIAFDLSNVLSPAADITVLVQNPTAGSLTMQSLQGNFYFNDKPGGTVSDYTPAIVGPNSETPIKLHVQSSQPEIINIITNFIEHAAPLVIAVKGTANVQGVTIPVNLQFNPQ